MPEYEIRDIALAPSGHTKIRWVKNNMPLLAGLEEKFLKEKPFEGVKISLSVHLETNTNFAHACSLDQALHKTYRILVCIRSRFN